MKLVPLLFLVLAAGVSAEDWQSRFGRGDGTFDAETFRVERSGSSVVTVLPARGEPRSRVRVELDGGSLVRGKTEYLVAELADWYRADQMLTEVQSASESTTGASNFAFQRVWHGEVQEAKNLPWGPEFVDFSTLPFWIESRWKGREQTWQLRAYHENIPGPMQLKVWTTDRPLDVEKRYAYPRWLRERFAAKKVVLAELTAVGEFKGGYPYPFYYAFTAEAEPRWIASWGGNPRSPTFQWRE